MSGELAPGALGHERTREGVFAALVQRLPADSLVLADARVLRLHPAARAALRAHRVLVLRAGERVKSLSMLGRLAERTLDLPRSATVLALGGGTIGDLATVFAHLCKRGVRLVHCPTTLLAAVDSSVGGKGAVNVGAAKNALGVFHAAAETWLCVEWFATLSAAQRLEGRIEAWKVALTDAPTWRQWCARAPADLALLRRARALKGNVVARDPYERRGVRAVLNFGHTFGHALESLSGYRVPHGVAVGAGIACALDVGVELGVTSRALAAEVLAHVPYGELPRRLLARVLTRATVPALTRALRADKKRALDALRMVLLRRPGSFALRRVDDAVWRALLPRWRRGEA